ncbi:MAG: transcription antitermination factor NusB [Leptospirales bacterium]|jgi:N utilization substance protein B|nr:transcription antitermination factor NusB [Leptospirales bacterium]
MSQRHKAREYALQGLYMYEVSKSPIENIIEFEWLDAEIPKNIEKFTIQLIEGVILELEKIDTVIKDYSKNWKFERISIIDKSILRLAIYEMIFMKDIPSAVTINECIDLGKTFGGENSGQFINGILDAVRKNRLKENKQEG